MHKHQKKTPHKAKLYIIRTKKHKNGGFPPFFTVFRFWPTPLTRPDTNPDHPPHSTTKPSKAILEVYFYKLSGTLCYFFNFFQMLVCRFCNIFNIAFQCTGRIWVVFYRFDIRTTIRALWRLGIDGRFTIRTHPCIGSCTNAIYYFHHHKYREHCDYKTDHRI